MRKLDWDFNKPYVIAYTVYLSLSYGHLGYFNLQYNLRSELHGIGNIIAKDQTFILGYFGAIVGSLLDSLVVKYSVRKRFMVGNAVVCLFSFPLYFRRPETLVALCSLLYGVGIGLVTSISPFYMKEVIPESIFLLSLASMQFFLIFGGQVAFAFRYIILEEKLTHGCVLGIVAFIVPGFVALIQTLLGFTVFSAETPLRLMQKIDDDGCAIELQKVYQNTKRRLAEFAKLRLKTALIKYKYPTYAELFSKLYRESTVKSFFFVVLSNCSGVFLSFMFTTHMYPEAVFGRPQTLLLMTLKFVCTFFLFAVICPKGIKTVSLVGACGTALTNYGNLAIRLIYNNVNSAVLPVIAKVNMGLSFFFDTFTTCFMFVLYACYMMTERGFALMMFVHWFIYGGLMISFFYIIEKLERHKHQVYIGYLTFFCASATAFVLFLWLRLPDEEKPEDVFEEYKKLNENAIEFLAPHPS